MADDVTPDANDADRTVTDDAFAVSPEPDVDRDVPEATVDPVDPVSRDEIDAAEDAEAVEDDPATEQEVVEALGAHDPSVEIPEDSVTVDEVQAEVASADPVTGLREAHVHGTAPVTHFLSGPDKGVFVGHAAVEAQRAAAEADIVADRKLADGEV